MLRTRAFEDGTEAFAVVVAAGFVVALKWSLIEFLRLLQRWRGDVQVVLL